MRGAPVVVLTMAFSRNDQPSAAIASEAFEPVLEAARERGLTVVLEPHATGLFRGITTGTITRST